MINITTNQLAETLIRDFAVNLYDLRASMEFVSGHAPDNHSLPFEELKYLNDPKNETYYFTCRPGGLPYYACQTLKSKGYRHLISINNGIPSWEGEIQSLT